MRNPVMLRDTAGEEDKHEQSLLIIDRTVLAGWTFLDLNPHSCNSQRILSPSCLPFHHSGSLRAKNGTRTRDPNLGKVVLYQLSYFRNCECKDKMLFCFCKITARKSNGKFCLRLYGPMEGNYVRDYKLTYFTAYSSTNIERLLFVSIMPFHGNHKYRYNILVNLVNKP